MCRLALSLHPQSVVDPISIFHFPSSPQYSLDPHQIMDDYDTRSIFRALAAGATGYLLKRTSKDELFAALRLVQTGGSPISSGIARLVARHFRASNPGKPTMMRRFPNGNVRCWTCFRGAIPKSKLLTISKSVPIRCTPTSGGFTKNSTCIPTRRPWRSTLSKAKRRSLPPISAGSGTGTLLQLANLQCNAQRTSTIGRVFIQNRSAVLRHRPCLEQLRGEL